MIKVLIVDDSAVVRKLLQRILEQDPDIAVVGEASDCETAVRAVQDIVPDVVTMDIRMPGRDGLEATRRIMQLAPVPIVIVSASYRPSDVEMTFMALDAGALAVLPKPPGIGHPHHETTARELVRTVKLMSEIRVIRRTPRVSRIRPTALAPPSPPRRSVRIIALGASTGGPNALRQILVHLSPDLPVPLLVVQHITPGFTRGFVDWLNQTSPIPASVAVHNEDALPGRVYVAPEGSHLLIQADRRLVLDASPTEHGMRPSVGALFRSVAQHFGDQAIGVLLTGMGRDGAVDLKLMKDRGAMTICQDRDTSTVHGMPGEAIRIGAATHVLALPALAPFINACMPG